MSTALFHSVYFILQYVFLPCLVLSTACNLRFSLQEFEKTSKNMQRDGELLRLEVNATSVSDSVQLLRNVMKKLKVTTVACRIRQELS
jgi:hypothetical protein